MSLSEFEIIDKFFKRNLFRRTDVDLGIGDDAALVCVPKENELAIATDTLVEDIHFPKNTKPEDIAFKSVAVNLSDLAAMGAKPTWLTLSLTIPKADEDWLSSFSRGFFEIADHYSLQLIGGDITHGPLTVTVQAHGFIPKGKALLRSKAQPNDKIYVSGFLGDAALALQTLKGRQKLPTTDFKRILNELNRPMPQVKEGILLRELANAVIDISDGLAADLNHILDQSNVGATLQLDQIPLSPIMRHHIPREEATQLALTGGDDYVLCFTVPKEKESQLMSIAASFTNGIYCVGEISKETGLNIVDVNNKMIKLKNFGYQHF